MSDPLSEDQSFLQEVLFRNGRQPSYVLYTAQSLADLERFCTNTSMPIKFRSVLAVDTTYNVSNYYVTQTTYRNLSLLHRNTQKHPWFPGPIFVHRHLEKDDFSYFWQAVKRGKLSLEDLAIIGTDECDELYNGILQESNGNTGHFLGKEHMIKTIQRKLNQLSFPKSASSTIVNDIFGDPFNSGNEALYTCESEQAYESLVEKLFLKWRNIERSHTKLEGNRFVDYFEKYKRELFKKQ